MPGEDVDGPRHHQQPSFEQSQVPQEGGRVVKVAEHDAGVTASL